MAANEAELRALMSAGLAGDATAYRALLGRLSANLRAYYKGRLARIGRSATEAEDLTQEALMAIHTRRFSKMHGAGNDFVVLDLRDGAEPPDPAQCRALADRHAGVGCDQILGIEAPRSAGAVASYRIWNAEGHSLGNGWTCHKSLVDFLKLRVTTPSPLGGPDLQGAGQLGRLGLCLDVVGRYLSPREK